MKTNLFKIAGKNIIATIFMTLIFSYALHAQKKKLEVETPAFSDIEIFDNMKISVSQGEKAMIIIEGEDAAVNAFIPDVQNGILKIKTDKQSEQLSAIEIIVTNLKSIKLKGASSLKSLNTIKTDELKITASDAVSIKLDVDAESLSTLVEGAASIKYKGIAKNHKIQIKGAASIGAYELDTENTQVDLAGAGTAQVKVKNELSGEISGLGSILYNEEPASINVKTSGLGSVKKASPKTDITNDGDTTKLNLGQKEIYIFNKPEEKEKKKKKEKFDGHWGGVEIGMNNYLNPSHKMVVPTAYDFLELRTNKSIGVSINIYEQNFKLYKDRVGIVSGLGLTYNNYRFINNTILTPKSPVVEAVKDTTRDFLKNKLTVSYLTVPLILEVNSGKNNRFHFGAGLIGGVRIGSHTKQVYEIKGSKFKDKSYDDFNLHPFKADATVRIGFGIINLFANYSLTPLFKQGKDPELYPFTVGLRVLGW